MTIYIALLRGINVSGHHVIKMERLRQIFETLPVRHVRTYIQSGNVIFEAEEQRTDALSKQIEETLQEALGYEVRTVVRSAEELAEIIARSPYAANVPAEQEKLYVTFLSALPTEANIAQLMTFQSDVDDFEVLGHEVYIRCRESYGKSVYSNNFLEKKLGVAATTRNWATVNKLLALAKA
ncbi:DUF1697 domain-containing protein [Paenibacillus guangzhouensis]|uniref:DUF1697 domain-containing protein n=1 Tax=Paenibacillus guangzhouensis TaxID=1473112 RepID=UPI001266C046|nr:DUF1697 domain-containing protein [Paenibacillus guangzhouensis]